MEKQCKLLPHHQQNTPVHIVSESLLLRRPAWILFFFAKLALGGGTLPVSLSLYITTFLIGVHLWQNVVFAPVDTGNCKLITNVLSFFSKEAGQNGTNLEGSKVSPTAMKLQA